MTALLDFVVPRDFRSSTLGPRNALLQATLRTGPSYEVNIQNSRDVQLKDMWEGSGIRPTATTEGEGRGTIPARGWMLRYRGAFCHGADDMRR